MIVYLTFFSLSVSSTELCYWLCPTVQSELSGFGASVANNNPWTICTKDLMHTATSLRSRSWSSLTSTKQQQCAYDPLGFTLKILKEHLSQSGVFLPSKIYLCNTQDKVLHKGVALWLIIFFQERIARKLQVTLCLRIWNILIQEEKL